jgi:hypothetical protein
MTCVVITQPIPAKAIPVTTMTRRMEMSRIDYTGNSFPRGLIDFATVMGNNHQGYLQSDLREPV